MTRSASDFEMPSLCEAMNAAFSDYPVPMQLSQDAFNMMMRIRGLDLKQSRVAALDGAIAAFWLVGLRRNVAYLISSGTRPAFRRRGLSKDLGAAVIEHLASNGIESIQTEVLENNPSARALYAALGFSESRVLDSFVLGKVQPIETPIQVTTSTSMPERAQLEALWDSAPSWQNDTDALAAAAKDAAYLTIYDGSGLAAYAAIVPATANLAQLAVRKDQRRARLGRALLAHGQHKLGLETLKAINVDRGNTAMSAFLKALGAEPLVSQRELTRDLQTSEANKQP